MCMLLPFNFTVGILCRGNYDVQYIFVQMLLLKKTGELVASPIPNYDATICIFLGVSC